MMLRPPPLDPDVLRNILFQVGFALWQIQSLEFTIAHYLVMVHKLEPGVARTTAEKVFDDTSKKTLGNLLSDLRRNEHHSSSLLRKLETFVPERNWLVHTSRHVSQQQVFTASKRHILLSRLNKIADDALEIMKAFQTALEAHMETHGITRKQTDFMADRIMKTWVDV
jgi:hypothetical protein